METDRLQGQVHLNPPNPVFDRLVIVARCHTAACGVKGECPQPSPDRLYAAWIYTSPQLKEACPSAPSCGGQRPSLQRCCRNLARHPHETSSLGWVAGLLYQMLHIVLSLLKMTRSLPNSPCRTWNHWASASPIRLLSSPRNDRRNRRLSSWKRARSLVGKCSSMHHGTGSFGSLNPSCSYVSHLRQSGTLSCA